MKIKSMKLRRAKFESNEHIVIQHNIAGNINKTAETKN